MCLLIFLEAGMNRRSEEGWDQIFSEQAESGNSQAGFCRERGISPASFYWHSKKRRERSQSQFVELSVTEEPKERGEHRAELELPGGVIFRMSW